MTQPATPPTDQPPADQGAPPAQAGTPPEQPKAPEIDWKAEARKWETRAKEYKPGHDRVKQVEDSQKTDLQRLQDQLATTAQERDAARVDATRVRLGLRYKLDEADLDFIPAGNDEEMDQRAKRLAERVAANKTPGFDGGARTPAPQTKDMNTFVRGLAGFK